MSETHIRWTAIDGTVVSWFGYVGTVKAPPFQILHPVAREAGRHRFDEWALCCTFLGEEGEPRYGGTDPEAPDRLKAEAERWLAEFVASLGAVFGDAVAADSGCGECGFGLPRHRRKCSHYREPIPPHPEEETDR